MRLSRGRGEENLSPVPATLVDYLVTSQETLRTSGFKVGEWLVQPDVGIITNGETSVQLEPKVMEVLVYLARNFFVARAVWLVKEESGGTEIDWQVSPKTWNSFHPR